MLLVLFKEIRAPEVDFFRRVFLGRLGFRALVGIGCYGRNTEGEWSSSGRWNVIL